MLFSDEEIKVALPFYQTAFPKELLAIKLMPMNDADSEQIYVPLVKATADVKFMDDDFTIGNCHCSNCRKLIDIFDKYCSHCGAKISGRREVHD